MISALNERNMEKAIGQLLMIGLQGTELTQEERKFLRDVQPAGVIYFKRNVESPQQLARLSQEIYKELSHPLIGIDQEGGRVARLGEPFTAFSSNASLGNYYQKTGKLDLVVKKAKAMAQELKAIGLNLNFTPVVDIHSNPANPIIGDRAFGTTPEIVGKLAQATIKTYRKEKVVSCAKHFPGHGDTYTDSHKELPTVNVDKKTLMKRELVPFQKSIAAGVPTIMTAHVVYPALDPNNPATLSKIILRDLLRKKMKYKGVVVSDDLEMNAIANHQTLSTAAIDAMVAGVDLLLVCKSLDQAGSIYEAIVNAHELREISAKEVKASLARMAKLKKEYAKKSFRVNDAKKYSWPNHQKWAQDILSYA